MEKGNKVRALKRKYHYIYKTTCIITGRYYIGMHSTDNLNDGYQGSGTILARSIRYHGKENHQTEILEFLPTRKDLKQREAELVNEELLNDTMCMNLALGGEGGARVLTKEQLSKGGINANRVKWSDSEFVKKMSEGMSARNKELHERGILKPFDWTGKKHTEESKKKMSQAAKRRTGEKNSQFGTCWIHNVETKQCIKIKNTEIDSYISEGWTQGRKMKFN